jgi:hypothetical protein
MDIIEKKEHLTLPGFYKVLSIKSVFPKGLSPEILEVYSKIFFFFNFFFQMTKICFLYFNAA